MNICEHVIRNGSQYSFSIDLMYAFEIEIFFMDNVYYIIYNLYMLIKEFIIQY